MDRIYDSMGYNSGWMPLVREDDGSVTTYLNPEISRAKGNNQSTARKNDADVTSEQGEIIKKLYEISEHINDLNNKIANQSKIIDRLVGLLEEKGTAGKKSAFGLTDILSRSRE